MKVVISGSRSIERLPKEAIKSLDRIMEQGFEVLIGDAPGVDYLCQKYLFSKGYEKVVVYHPFTCRNNVGFPTIKAGQSYSDRDRIMCQEANFGLAIWDGISKGTLSNIQRVPKTKVIKIEKVGDIKVVNKKTLSSEIGWKDIYIGRPSPLGNPYAMKSEGERAVVIELFHRWLWERIKWGLKADPSLDHSSFKELLRIAKLVKSGSNVRLICWCNPKDCHGDIIARAVKWLINENIV